jgi:mRNA-degrading endonuclease RelE of RelBE toxin-antitoxin system
LYSSEYLEDYKLLDAFERPKVRSAVLMLAEEAEMTARNRRPLRTQVSWCPEATWRLHVEDYRVLYRVDAGTVFVLRVRFKGSRTIEDMGS